MISKTVCAYFSLYSGDSHEPSLGLIGQYWVNRRQTCEPSLHSVGSKVEGITISIIGFVDGQLVVLHEVYDSESRSMFSQLR